MKLSKALTFWPVLLGLVAVDCTTKQLAVDKLSPAVVPHEVVGDVVRFTLAYNPDAAMGLSLGEYSRIGFGVIAVVMIAALFVYRRRLGQQSGLQSVALGMIAGGATGNLIDRVRSEQGVVDFIDVGVGTARFYTFNIADAAVFCGAVLLLLLLARQDSRGQPASMT